MGCISDDVPSNNNDRYTDQVLPDQNVETHSVSLNKSAVLDIENGYSLKLLEINKKENYVRFSFRKEGQDYLASKLITGNTYSIKDPNGEYAVYSVNVDKIHDNSFFIDLTYATKAAIAREIQVSDADLQKVPELSIGNDTITRYYEWEYDGTKFSMTAEYYKDSYEVYSERTRSRDFDQFVTDTYDDMLISQLTSQMEEMAHDGGGDCEDSSILLASLLYDMGYGVALPRHMAVGVKGDDDLSGSYYNYDGTKYFYLEPTNSGWDVGAIPDEYKNESVIITPIGSVSPELRLTFTGAGEKNSYQTSVDLEITIENVGSITAEDVVIHTTLESTDEGMVWDQIKSDTMLSIVPESSITYSVFGLKVPAGESYRVGITAWGSNVNSEYIFSEWTSS
ncbi:hypothetical protein [Methanococcoides alaskense]|uniref:Transglutaminase-like domain-containing protein n=1 Tax=Methanococcoides alaskense TaxID=325778 RepID=A0AA90U0N4_9EURY|nr:hypothetical protein [Methanococcoides alaskense]MDA0524261.1 hypothetical protein [Methanococcoides alaskense]MDR6223788.1 hypothetical protein [Methanococcoides alaskense]